MNQIWKKYVVYYYIQLFLRLAELVKIYFFLIFMVSYNILLVHEMASSLRILLYVKFVNFMRTFENWSKDRGRRDSEYNEN